MIFISFNTPIINSNGKIDTSPPLIPPQNSINMKTSTPLTIFRLYYVCVDTHPSPITSNSTCSALIKNLNDLLLTTTIQDWFNLMKLSNHFPHVG